jgi:hydrogenase nickel incorporation protein HypA/HybF
MHERSLVQALLEQVRETAAARELPPVREVVLEVGEFCGVDAELVELAFGEMAPAMLGHDVGLELRRTPLTAECRSCGHGFAVERFRFVCPICSGDVAVTGGEEFRLVSLRVAAGPVVEEQTCR